MSATNGAVALAAVSKPWNPLSWFRRKPAPKPAPKPKLVPYKVEFVSAFTLGYSQMTEHVSTIGIEDSLITYVDAEKKYAEAFKKRVAAVKREIRTKRFVEADNGMVRSSAVKNLRCRLRIVQPMQDN